MSVLSPKAFFESNDPRREDVVLKVDVGMEIGFQRS